MSRVRSAAAVVERTRWKVNDSYDMSVQDVRELETRYEERYSLLFAVFIFGYAQGMKAEKARTAKCTE